MISLYHAARRRGPNRFVREVDDHWRRAGGEQVCELLVGSNPLLLAHPCSAPGRSVGQAPFWVLVVVGVVAVVVVVDPPSPPPALSHPTPGGGAGCYSKRRTPLKSAGLGVSVPPAAPFPPIPNHRLLCACL